MGRKKTSINFDPKTPIIFDDWTRPQPEGLSEFLIREAYLAIGQCQSRDFAESAAHKAAEEVLLQALSRYVSSNPMTVGDAKGLIRLRGPSRLIDEIRSFRTRDRHERSIEMIEDLAMTSPSEDHRLRSEEFLQRLLELATPKQLPILKMKIKGMSDEEIAEEAGEILSKVKALLRRYRNKADKSLVDEGNAFYLQLLKKIGWAKEIKSKRRSRRSK